MAITRNNDLKTNPLDENPTGETKAPTVKSIMVAESPSGGFQNLKSDEAANLKVIDENNLTTEVMLLAILTQIKMTNIYLESMTDLRLTEDDII